MLKFDEYLRVNNLDNKIHEYQEGKPPYTYDDYVYEYGKEYIRYINASLTSMKGEKTF